MGGRMMEGEWMGGWVYDGRRVCGWVDGWMMEGGCVGGWMDG